MKKWITVLLLSLVAACHAQAQASSVAVELSLDQEQFLPNEDIRVAVRVANFSGQLLELGKDDSWVSFTVDSRDKYIIEKYSNPDVTGIFSLESTQAGTKRVNITPHFNIQKPGRYQISARVRIPQWNLEVVSQPVSFDVVRGSKLREIQFGVPSVNVGQPGTPEVRKYILQQAEYRKEMKLYIRLTDAHEVKTIKLFPISRMMSFSRPEVQLDKFSNLHVLHQSGQNSFSYCTMNPFGQITTFQRHDYYGDSRPRLVPDENGRISVRGGNRVETDTDVPPPDVSTTDANADQP